MLLEVRQHEAILHPVSMLQVRQPLGAVSCPPLALATVQTRSRGRRGVRRPARSGTSREVHTCAESPCVTQGKVQLNRWALRKASNLGALIAQHGARHSGFGALTFAPQMTRRSEVSRCCPRFAAQYRVLRNWRYGGGREERCALSLLARATNPARLSAEGALAAHVPPGC
jgi:hypothetical protein